MPILSILHRLRGVPRESGSAPPRLDLPSRLLLDWLKRHAKRRRLAPAGVRRDEDPFRASPALLSVIRRVTGRPSFPMPLSSLQVRRVLDLRVPGATELRPARMYIPYGRPKGVVLYLHGGGFVHCGLNSHHGICCRLARSSGAVILSFAYRLAPENKFPAAVEDSWAALEWLSSEAWRWGGLLAVAGDSAGGTLATVLCHRARDQRRRLGKAGAPDPIMQLLLYPATLGKEETPSRQLFAHGYFLTTAMMEWYGHQYARSEEDVSDPRFAPGLQPDLSDLPPAWIMTAQCDPLRDEAAQYGEALRQAGSIASYICVPGTFHGFLQFYPMMPKGRHVLKLGARALRRAFREK